MIIFFTYAVFGIATGFCVYEYLKHHEIVVEDLSSDTMELILAVGTAILCGIFWPITVASYGRYRFSESFHRGDFTPHDVVESHAHSEYPL